MPSTKFLQITTRLPAFWLGLMLTGLGAVSNLTSGQAQEDRASAGAATEALTPKLIREGTRIVKSRATCRSAADRLSITLDEHSQPLIALENLAAQRVLESVLDDAGDSVWIVSGQVTEFQGQNYLLLDRVVRESKR